VRSPCALTVSDPQIGSGALDEIDRRAIFVPVRVEIGNVRTKSDGAPDLEVSDCRSSKQRVRHAA
jgi:hypothetical protein